MGHGRSTLAHLGLVTSSLPWKDRRVFVTGATGMVGSWLCRRLVELGADVSALVRDLDPQSELYRSGTIDQLSVVSGRLEDYSTVGRAVSEHEPEVILHLGAQAVVGTAQRSPLPTLEANVMGTANVLEAARVHRRALRAIVIASSDKAYGEKRDLPYVEEMSLEGRAPYEVSKSCTDLIAHSYFCAYGLPVAIGRLGNVYGGGDRNWTRLVPGTIRALLRGHQPVIRSDGTYLRDYLHVADAVLAYLALAEQAGRPDVAGEAFNFSAERPVSVMEVYRAVCLATVGREVEPLVLSHADHEIHDQYLDATKARKVLGWQAAYSLEEGLPITVDWYRSLLGT